MTAFRSLRPAAVKRWVQSQYRSRLLQSHPLGDTECGLIAACGIGDHLLVLALSSAVTAHHGLRVATVAGAPRFAFLRDLFPAPPAYVAWQAHEVDARWANRLAAGRYFYTHFPLGAIRDRIGIDGHHFLDAYRTRLSLPSTAGLTPRRQPNDAELRGARDTLIRLGLPPGRTVILAPDANTTPTGGDHADFWFALASALKAHGWTPTVNGGPATPDVPGVGRLPAPLADVRALAVAAGAVVSVRSGWSDLTCDLPCRRVVMFPDVRFFSGTLRESTTFARYGLGDPPGEVLLGSDGIDATVERVLDVL